MKTFTLLLFTLIACSSFAIRKKKLIEMVRHCNITYNPNDAGAGKAFVAGMEINFDDGSSNHTRENPTKINFKDFEVEVSGSGRLTRHSKKGIRIRTVAESIHRPYVIIKVKMKDRRDMNATLKVPLHYRVSYTLAKGGPSGFSGDCGRNGRKGHMGRDRYYKNGYGEDGDRGWNGNHGLAGGRGADGPHVEVYVSKIPFERDQTELMMVEVYRNGKKADTRYVDPNGGSISISANGGTGGSGGNGGCGGAGGNGGDGSFEKQVDGQCVGRDGYGGDGGDGGHGGHGGPGGDGGNGGQIDVFFADGTMFFKDRMNFYVFGGSGGSGGCGGQGGTAGRGGKGGKGAGRKGYCGKPGMTGPRGMDGLRGSVNIYDWK